MKRIALVINTLQNGGAERVVSNLSMHLAARYDIDILVNNDSRLDYPYSGNLISLDIPEPRDRLSLRYLLKMLLRKTPALRRLKRERNYAAVISFNEVSNLANVLSGYQNTKAIVSIHSSPEGMRKAGEKALAIRKMNCRCYFPKAYKIVCCSKEIVHELMTEFRLPKERFSAIYNGIDLEEIRGKIHEPLPGADEDFFGSGPTVVSLGRLAREKGQWHLIRAVKHLRDEGLDVKLLILGEGPLRGALEDLVRKEHLDGIVKMPGFVKNPFRYMARADAAVFPSLFEGFSNAIPEAMACGIPCISTDHKSGAREILAPDTDYRNKNTGTVEEAPYGILVPVCDGVFKEAGDPLTPEELLMAEAIKKVLTDTEVSSRYRLASVKRAEELRISSVCRQWAELIDA